MSLSDAESQLQAHLGNQFVDSNWQTALTAVIEAEKDTKKALETIDDLCKAAISRLGLKFWIPARPTNPVATKSQQPLSVKEDLMGKVKLLKSHNHIFGDVPTVEELLDPVEEREQEEAVMDGSVKGIIKQVQKELAEVNREVIEVDESDGDDEHEADKSPVQSCHNLISHCQQLVQSCMQYGDPQTSLDLANQLLKFRAVLRRDELLNSTQTTLDRFFEKWFRVILSWISW